MAAPATAPATAPAAESGQQQLLFDPFTPGPESIPGAASPADPPIPSPAPTVPSGSAEVPAFDREEAPSTGPAYDPPDFDAGPSGPSSGPELAYGDAAQRRPSAPAPAWDGAPSEGFSDFGFDTPAGQDAPAADPTPEAPTLPGPVTDPATLAWDALEGSGADGEEATGSAAPAGDDPYYQHLGDDHFDHRPAPRREMPWVPALALGIVLIGALAYLFGGQIF
ncbi:MAG: hypothetical protein MI919_02240, partial [Holophagales bacterium]|nr:hypothetical protein [Holophagales bacterium]